jgi:hypothetical protein
MNKKISIKTNVRRGIYRRYLMSVGLILNLLNELNKIILCEPLAILKKIKIRIPKENPTRQKQNFCTLGLIERVLGKTTVNTHPSTG